MPLGEAFLGAFFGAVLNVLFDRLTSPELLPFLRQEGFEKEIKEWTKTREMINAVLVEVEDKQLVNDAVWSAVKMWLDDLEELAYDVEDMLEEFEYEAAARKTKMDELQSSKFWKHVPAGFSNCSLDVIKFRFRMRSKVNDFTTRFDRFGQLRQSLGLEFIRGGPALQRVRTLALPTEASVYGRDEDKKILLERLLKNEPTDANLLVIPIVGMVGVGKTMLAHEVYEASEVRDRFRIRAWVCVSDGESFVTRISKSILENITGSSSDLPNDLRTIQDKLKEQVVGKKFLLVLDDVWSNFYSKWETLQSPFTASAVGSRIIVTTRDEGVALNLRPNGSFHRLGPLKPDDCWLVFSMCAFENGAVPAHHAIASIREKVIEKSKGLPLAAKTLGGFLRSKQIDRWLEILNNKLWDLSEKEGMEISAALKLSYYRLPSHLRACFAYCAIFPEDYEFEIEEVVLLWIAEGLVQQLKKNEQLEESGYKYFSDLLGKSMFQQSSSNNGHKFVMHEFAHDLAQWALGERSLRLDGVLDANGQSGGLEKVRHFSYTFEKYDGKKRFKVFEEVENLKAKIRTFLPIPQIGNLRYIANSISCDLLQSLRRLRVLSLQSYCVPKVRIPAGDLKHLRYLNLSNTMIRCLPESTNQLYNLQILLLRDCSRLEKLPSHFKYLIKLRHLDIKGSILIKEMPLGMEKLQNLQKLSNFIVGKGVCSDLEDLKSLNMLREELCISKLDDVISCNCKILENKKDLEKLLLMWGSQFHKLQNEVIEEEELLNMLQPHENLQELTITYYGGTKFPLWVGNASYSKIKVLRLKNCQKCTDLPSFGALCSLEKLTIEGMKSLTHISSEFYGKDQIFKSLRALCFEDLPVWVDWEPVKENEHGVAFPCLKSLSIKKCPLFSRSLPRRLFALEELVIEDLPVWLDWEPVEEMEYGVAFPCLKKLSIKKCPQLSRSLPGLLSALEELVIENCEQLVVSFSNSPELCKIEINGCKRIACDNAVDFKSIMYLTLSNISEFSNQLMQECFGKDELQQIKHNRSEVQLAYEICPKKPPVGGLQSIRFLRELVISYCSNIDSFLEVCSLPNLNKLEIVHCNALISLPEEMKMKNECLESLKIQSCNSLEIVVRGQLPPSLKWLEISECGKLESLWDDREGSCSSTHGKKNGNNTNASLLEYLRVSDCLSLTCLSSIIQLPATLKHLEFVSCQQLALSINLRSLNSLEDLKISGCPSVTSFHPEEFPTSLKSLRIGECENAYRQLIGCRLQNLTSLTSLEFWDFLDLKLFPQQKMEMMLPSSLIHLKISRFPKLKQILSQGFKNLTSLQSLTIENCSDLISLGDQGLPSSLEFLNILDCEKLTCLPKQGLPSSLQALHISRCPRLKEECKRNKRREWSRISNILEVTIDGRLIFDLKEDEEAQSSSCYSCHPVHCCNVLR